VDRLERGLNEEPALAAQLAARRPELGPRLAGALEALARRDQPVPQRWEQAWQAIDTAATRPRRPTPRPIVRNLRYWPGLLAAAACALLAFLWSAQPAERDEWPMRLATSVEIDNLEVPEGATSFVVSTGGQHSIQVIWVLEDQG
jgi:hypothetical protein